MFFKKNKEKVIKKRTCDGSNFFVWGFFIVITIYFLLQYSGQIPENFATEFLNKK